MPPEDKNIQERINLMNGEIEAIQDKYQLRMIAQVQFPGGAFLNVPIQVLPYPSTAKKAVSAEAATDPTN